MIDHVLGRPSSRFRKIQVFLVLSFWTTYLLRGHSHGPPLIRRLSRFLRPRITPWQTVTLTMLYLYFARNFAKIIGLECPEPLANLYSRSYFRATWVMTALDAGFWTAMPIRWKWLRDIASIVFSVYYLFAAEQADEKVRRVRAMITVEHLRVGWEKSQTPYLKLLTQVMHPLRNRYKPRHVRIPRPKESMYTDPVDVWIYFEGTREELLKQTKIVLDFPGGGFVAMGPRNHEDKLVGWSRKLKCPIVGVEYRKAPEWPYPYALNECYDVYHEIIATSGRCVGLSGEIAPRVAIAGDSAGGNFAAGVVLMIINSANIADGGREKMALPLPAGLLLIYPSLDMNISSWMSDDQVRLIQERSSRKTNRGVVRRKSDYFAQASGKKLPVATTSRARRAVRDGEEPYDSSDSEYESKTKTAPGVEDVTHIPVTAPTKNTDLLRPPPPSHQSTNTSTDSSNNATSTTLSVDGAKQTLTNTKPKLLSTRLAMTSRLTYFNDRILAPEMMRAMVILYIGPHNRPDFATDFLLSPLVAPDHLLAQFPKTFFLTGERDPLVDDTVVMAGKIGRAKRNAAGRLGERSDMPEVRLIPGISHGFLLMAGVFPEARREIVRCARWLGEVLDRPDPSSTTTSSSSRLLSQTLAMTTTTTTAASSTTTFPPDYQGTDTPRATSPVDAGGRQRHHYRTDTGTTSVGMDSTDEEDLLEMELAMTPAVDADTSAGVAGWRTSEGGLGRGRRGGGVGPKAKGKLKGIGRLASEEDLVGRRMRGLMGGLTGLEDLEA